MRKGQLKTAPWKTSAGTRREPADEPHIAREREVLDAELRLAAVRKRHKASQAAVAKKPTVSRSKISQLERGAEAQLSTVARGRSTRSGASNETAL